MGADFIPGVTYSVARLKRALKNRHVNIGGSLVQVGCIAECSTGCFLIFKIIGLENMKTWGTGVHLPPPPPTGKSQNYIGIP